MTIGIYSRYMVVPPFSLKEEEKTGRDVREREEMTERMRKGIGDGNTKMLVFFQIINGIKTTSTEDEVYSKATDKLDTNSSKER